MSQLVHLASPESVDRWIEAGSERSQWLFKHSLTCSVSTEARKEFERFMGQDGAGTPSETFAWIKIQEARAASRHAAERLGVRHESPQVLLIRDGEVVWHASHWEITAAALAEAADGG